MIRRDIGALDGSPAKHIFDVAEYCRRAGISEAEQRRLVKVLGPYASSHELQMNIVRPRIRTR
ncbi:hypothetical protein [Sinorhizobium terangae]|uniref:hypothetical protein n=1 Tax=Sinorhizobium terangae TaxID=110322 RepID=UPI0024B12252|nr:hypothetical protein [Sinorhizobium terangae]WFU49832.1 hypothetical protein QA637_23745 [Sinorhizobium terangae]